MLLQVKSPFHIETNTFRMERIVDDFFLLWISNHLQLHSNAEQCIGIIMTVMLNT